MFTIGDIIAILSFLAGSLGIGIYIGKQMQKAMDFGEHPLGGHPHQPKSWHSRLTCTMRRQLRRFSWYYLFPLVVLTYRWFYNLLIYIETSGLNSADVREAAAAAAAKMVDPVQFYSKSWIAFSNFCWSNAMGFGSLLVVPVLIDWATGYYSQKKNANAVGLESVVVGFKRTFLSLDGPWRMGFYLLVWAIELGVAVHSVESAFRMQ